MPAELREPCPRPARPDAPTLGALALFSVRQEEAVAVCEGRKDAAVSLLDAAAAALDEAVGKKVRRP